MWKWIALRYFKSFVVGINDLEVEVDEGLNLKDKSELFDNWTGFLHIILILPCVRKGKNDIGR